MTKYDVIYESLQAKVESGELSLQEADELNQLAFEKYSDEEVIESEEDDSITLEEAMDYISSVLMEDKSDIEVNSDAGLELQRIKSKAGHNGLIRKMYKSSSMNDSTKRDPSTRSKLSSGEFKFLKDLPTKNNKKAYKIANVANREYKKQMKNKEYSTLTNKIIDGDLNGSEQLAKNSIKAITKGIKSVKESVDELRLQVYEAFEEGSITAEEKTVYLDYLNLENYQ